MLPMEGLRFQGPEGTFSKTKASLIGTMQAPKADRWHAGRALHAKEEVGRGGGAHREWCSVGETRRRGTVVGVCLVPEGISLGTVLSAAVRLPHLGEYLDY